MSVQLFIAIIYVTLTEKLSYNRHKTTPVCDTPAFPTSETPLPYHPLLYRRDSTENRVHPSYKPGNTPVSR